MNSRELMASNYVNSREFTSKLATVTTVHVFICKRKTNLNEDYLHRFRNKMKGLNILIDEINENKVSFCLLFKNKLY